MKKIVIVSLVLINACSSPKLVTSMPEAEMKSNVPNYFNSASNVAYSISNNAQNLHVMLRTSDQSSILKILKTGLHVYFDINGKTKKNVYILYPIGGMNKMPWPATAKGNDQSIHFDLQSLLNQPAKGAIYSYYGSTETLKEESGIKASLIATIHNELIYNLVIPFERIYDGTGWSRTNISIGIVSGNFVAPETGGAMVSGNPIGGEMYNYRQASNINQAESRLFTSIKFWLKVELHK